MAKGEVNAGTTSFSVNVFIQNSSSTTGGGLTGLAYNTSGLTAYYDFTGANSGSVAISLATLAAVNSAWSSGGFKEKDSTHEPGVYRLDIPNAALASGNGQFVTLYLQGATNMAPCLLEIELTATNNQDGTRGGMSALPNTSCTTNASLLTSGTGTDQLSVASGKVLLQATQTGVTIPTVTTVTNQLTAAQVASGVWQDSASGDFTASSSIGKSLYTSGNAPGAASGLALVGSNVGAATSVSGAVGSVTGNVGGNVVGSTASVTGAVGSVTGNVSGDVAGKVLGGGASSISGAGVRADQVTGAVGSVTGAVGSVTGNVGGNVIGSVASVVATVSANMVGIISTALSESVAGYLAAAFKKFFNLASPTSTMNEITLVDTTTNLTNSSSSDPWATALPGSYTSGEAGNILGNLTASGGSGANAVTITVTDASSNPIQNAIVRFTSGANSYVQTTNATGVCAFSLNNATWTVTITASGYSFAPTTLVVSATTNHTYQMTLIVITPSSGTLPQVTGYTYVYNSAGVPAAGIAISATLVKADNLPGLLVGTVFTATSDNTGLVQWTGLFKGATYRLTNDTSAVGQDLNVYIPPTNNSTPVQFPPLIGWTS